MSAKVVIHLGPACSGKTRELLRLYRDALRLSPRPGGPSYMNRNLWLAPTTRNAALVREELLAEGLAACLSPGVMTIGDLTNLVLSSNEAEATVSLIPATERELLRRIIQSVLERNELTHYRDASGRTGFVDLLAEHIRELKRRGIAPAAYARLGGHRDRAAEHHELGLLYAEYERQLAEHGLCDAEGRHATARDVLAAGACPRLQNLAIVVVDGFTDFTRTQHEILQQLAQHSAELHITLVSDSSAEGRHDLFAKTAATLAELGYFHRKLEVQRLPPRSLDWPALDHLARHIFRNPRQIPPLADDATASLCLLEIVEAAGAHDEIVAIARRIKRRIVSGEARPGEIVVAFRSLLEAAPRIREVFTEFGIPYSLETGLPLGTAAVLRMIVALVRLDDEDWPFRRVVAVLTNNLLTTLADDARQAAEWLVRDLQIAKGRTKLLERVKNLAADNTPPAELSDHARRRVEMATAAKPAFQLIATALDQLPKSAMPGEWRIALGHLGEQLGFPVFADTAWSLIEQHLVALERLNTSLGEPNRTLSRRQLLDWLVDLARHELLPRLHDDVGRVRVLGAATARTVPASHLYLAGMSEQAFPSPDRAGRLATAEDYRFFAGAADQRMSASVPLGPPELGRPQEEMLLFYELVTRAEKSLTISYPALDERAQQLPPSPYVTELVRTLDPAGKLAIPRSGPQLSPIPSADKSPLSLSEWRVQAVARAVGIEGDLGLLAGLVHHDETKPLAAALEAGLRIVHARQRRDDFGPAEGLLSQPAVAARLAKRFGPAHHWSPTQWETYAACPYRFYLEDVLKLEPLGDLTLETDHRRRGSLLHHVLATFHRKFGADPADAWAALKRDEARFVAELRETLQAAIDAMPRDGIDAALLELDRRQIDKWSGLYPGQHGNYDGAWMHLDEPPRPAHFELRFGPKRSGDNGPEDPRSTDRSFPIDIGGETIYVTGRIDRIDVGRVGDNTVFNIVDYKSGRRATLTSDKLESGERLQPALYVMAAEASSFGEGKATPLWAGYWSMQNGVTTNARYSLKMSVDGTTAADEWKDLRPKIIQRIGQFVTAIRRGDFPVASRDPDCTSRCEFNTVCRVAQIRSLGKTWQPES